MIDINKVFLISPNRRTNGEIIYTVFFINPANKKHFELPVAHYTAKEGEPIPISVNILETIGFDNAKIEVLINGTVESIITKRKDAFIIQYPDDPDMTTLISLIGDSYKVSIPKLGYNSCYEFI